MQILIATEGAPHSDRAIHLGARIARESRSNVTLLTVIESGVEREAGDALLERARGLLEIPEENLRVQVRKGQPSAEIIRVAEEGAYDLVIIGERPLSRVVKRFFSQTADRVIREMPCPVLLSRSAGPLRRMLVCEGGHDPRLLPVLVGRLGPLLRTADEIEVLHVISQMTAAPGVPGWELRADVEEHMERQTPEGELLKYDLKLLGRLKGVDLEAKIRHGVVVDEILEEARRGQFDLIVVGAHTVTGWQRLLSVDRVQQLLLRSELPLLIV